MENAPSPAGLKEGHLVLFVDDDPHIAALGQRLLQKLGYRADALTNSVAALELIRANPKNYSLILTDQLIPTLSGTALAKHVHEIRPDLPVVLVTGCLDFFFENGAYPPGICEILLKPFSMRSLNEAVGRAIATAEASNNAA